VVPDQVHQILEQNSAESRDPSECTLGRSQTAFHHPVTDVALVDTQTVAEIARPAEVWVLGFAVSEGWAAEGVAEVAVVVEAVVVAEVVVVVEVAVA